MSEEQIIQALEESFVEVVEPDEDVTFAEFIDGWFEDAEMPVALIAEIIMNAVEKLSSRKFAWYWEADRDDRFGYSGKFAFVMVDPESKRCLTMRSDSVCYVVYPVTNLQEAVVAVAQLLECATK